MPAWIFELSQWAADEWAGRTDGIFLLAYITAPANPESDPLRAKGQTLKSPCLGFSSVLCDAVNTVRTLLRDPTCHNLNLLCSLLYHQGTWLRGHLPFFCQLQVKEARLQPVRERRGVWYGANRVAIRPHCAREELHSATHRVKSPVINSAPTSSPSCPTLTITPR